MTKYVLFDLDGTLLDTSEGIMESVRHTASVLGLANLSEDRLRTFIGPPLTWSFSAQYGCDEETAKCATRIFREYYNNGALLKARVYSGIDDLCDQLQARGIRQAVATNKPDRFAKGLLKHFNLSPYFDSIRGASEDGRLKKTDLIKLCLRDLGAVPDESILVGDTINDAKGAEEAHVPFLAVTYGFGFQTEEELQGFRCVGLASSPSAILQIIEKKREDGQYERTKEDFRHDTVL